MRSSNRKQWLFLVLQTQDIKILIGNQWSLTIEGNHGSGEKQESDIEMQLFVKNKNNGNPNQTWKFSIKNEGKYNSRYFKAIDDIIAHEIYLNL